MTNNNNDLNLKPSTREVIIDILKGVSSILCKYLDIPEPGDEIIIEIADDTLTSEWA